MAKELPEDLTLKLALQIKRLRLARCWTREELAVRSGINVYTLKHFERTGQISLERLLKVCQNLDILDELLRAFKPRQRVDVNNWAASLEIERKRGRKHDNELVEA